jgi:ribosomal protein S18 acetylase RimI-like enzyme
VARVCEGCGEAAAKLFGKLLPSGVATPGHHVLAVEAGSAHVGYAWLRIAASDAIVYDLDISDESLGKAAMGAVESFAAERGATLVRINVFRCDAGLRRIVDGLGFSVANSQMRRRLDGPAAPVSDHPSVELRPMSDEDFAEFVATETAGYAEGLVRARLAGTLAEALKRSVAESAESLPDGIRTEGQTLLTAYAGDASVGTLWLEIGEPGSMAYVSDLRVKPECRRHGYGRSIMLAAERLCRQRGATMIGLSVFGFNDSAQALYEHLGYEITEQMHWKDVSAA